MALTNDEKRYLDQLRKDLIKRTGPQAEELNRITNELVLTGISAADLESLTNSKFTLGINFNEIDTSGESTGGKFTSFDMNIIAPGSIDETVLKAKLSNQSMLQARVTDVIDSQGGLMSVVSEVKINADIEEVIETKTKSQGTNLQMINRSANIDAQKVDSKPIKSKFLE